MDKKSKGKVFVGLSGGVDSSVSAALLQKQGFTIVGVFLKVWQPEFLRGSGVCTETADRRDAMRVAAHLHIPFIALDCAKEYKKEVVDQMIAEYALGRVPNPDVLCNREIKFGVFLREAKKRGADFIATGHYARIRSDHSLPTTHYQLLRGVDKNKDQSYFLWTLTQEHLASTLFPVGGFEKKKVRMLAKKFGLPTAERKDSQGICFIGKADMKEFLQHYIPRERGRVLDSDGRNIGTHDGVSYYAIGERHGFKVRGRTDAAPLYVVAKDIKRNTMTVAPKNRESAPESDTVILAEMHWIHEAPTRGKMYTAHVRYRGTDIPATIEAGAQETIVRLSKREFISEGQSLVLYDGPVCMGGGIVRGLCPHTFCCRMHLCFKRCDKRGSK